MRKKFHFLLLFFCGMLTLNAQEYLDCVRKVKAYLDRNYASGWPLYATEEQKLLDIASSDKSRKEKAAEIRKTFPKVFELSEAEKKYLASAMAGDAKAQNDLGWCYLNGDGVKKDYRQAVYWYKKSAAQGNIYAQNNLGWCYENGNGVEKNLNQAFFWYSKAANQGEMYAQNNLGLCYYFGNGVEKNLNQAFYWFKKSAEQGYSVAQHNVGVCYENGYGVYKDRYTAVSWYRKAAAQGYEDSKKVLRNMGYSY
ncbi:MAG: sel1 repeat family protein [Lentisphaerae bacterium]|nr:sel1 repeat family protein [Lentisphaerota bacterium]